MISLDGSLFFQFFREITLPNGRALVKVEGERGVEEGRGVGV